MLTKEKKLHVAGVLATVLGILCFMCPALSQSTKTGLTPDNPGCTHLPADFRVDFNVCNQHEVDFTNTSLQAHPVSWDLGDGQSVGATDTLSHVYDAEGLYTVKMVVMNKYGCLDTTIKNFLLTIEKGNIFSSKQLNVCKGASFHMPGDSDATQNCWSPGTFLDSTTTYNPLCTPLTNIAYQYNTKKRGPSAVYNGNFSGGNAGFSTGYVFDSSMHKTGYYFVGPRPKRWNRTYENCFIAPDIFGDTMMIVDGSTQSGVTVWAQTMSVIPNTNYAFGFFAQSLTQTDSLVLKVSINNGEIVNHMRLAGIPCIRQRLSTSWFSGNNSSIDIQITDLDTAALNNNFALDSISLKPIYLATDSIHLALIPPPVLSVSPNDTTICAGDSALITASGGDIYTWFPAATVSQPFAAATEVFPASETTYKVVITENTCHTTDSVFSTVRINPLPNVTVSKSNDVTCALVQATLNATGGISYHWQPESTLSDPFVPNPLAEPHDSTKYFVEVTGVNGCIAKDSIQLNVTPQGAINYVIPNAFTPNNDGRNDCFGIARWGNVANLDFFIYNRWGNIVFSTQNASQCWDGNYKGIPQPAGTYIYLIRGNTICGNIYRKGALVLLR